MIKLAKYDQTRNTSWIGRLQLWLRERWDGKLLPGFWVVLIFFSVAACVLRQSLQEEQQFNQKGIEWQNNNNQSMSKALIIVDLQNDFCERGSLSVPGSSEIFAPINALKKRRDLFSKIILTRDWHPLNHVSFASTHNLQPFTAITIEGKLQQLWPEHCVAGTNGAQLSPLLQTDPSDIILNKGIFANVDSYSGFAWHNEASQLKALLEKSNVKEVYVVGLAFDFCVGSTALDAKKCGFKTFVIEEATRSVSGASEKVMRQRLKENGVQIISASQISQQ